MRVMIMANERIQYIYIFRKKILYAFVIIKSCMCCLLNCIYIYMHEIFTKTNMQPTLTCVKFF